MLGARPRAARLGRASSRVGYPGVGAGGPGEVRRGRQGYLVPPMRAILPTVKGRPRGTRDEASDVGADELDAFEPRGAQRRHDRLAIAVGAFPPGWQDRREAGRGLGERSGMRGVPGPRIRGSDRRVGNRPQGCDLSYAVREWLLAHDLVARLYLHPTSSPF